MIDTTKLHLKVEGQPTGQPDKYQQALSKYRLDITDAEMAQQVQAIVAKAAENNNPEVWKFLLGSVELTSLHTTDTEEEILALVEKVNAFAHEYAALPHVATICTYPCFAKLVSQSL